jgi:hypothetical protein
MKHSFQKINNWLLNPHSKGFFEQKTRNINQNSLAINKQNENIDHPLA